MRLTHLLLEGFRSYDRAELHPSPALTIVTGPNAAGKTNLLEAIFVAIAGRSHRAAGEHELVRHGSAFARVRLDLADPAAAAEQATDRRWVELILPAGGSAEVRKRLLVNGVPRRPASLADTVRAVLFRPEEMLLLVGPPAERRRFLDTILAQRDRRLARDLVDLARVLAQRNALLRAIRLEEAAPSDLAFWDDRLVEIGSRVVHARIELVERLAEIIRPLHRRIAPDDGEMGEVDLEYVDSLKRPQDSAASASLEQLARDFRRRLDDVRQKELWNGVSLVGPQRDDLRVLLGGRDVGAHASRGQQRTIILALKLAETELLSGGEPGAPIVLLDDVFSELDPHRVGRALELLLERGQVLVTTADLRSLPASHRSGVPIWQVRDGRLSDAPLVA